MSSGRPGCCRALPPWLWSCSSSRWARSWSSSGSSAAATSRGPTSSDDRLLMSTVRFVSVQKHYGQTVAVDDFNLDVADGELVTLLGPSGCGKTTTLRMTAGLIEPTAG